MTNFEYGQPVVVFWIHSYDQLQQLNSAVRGWKNAQHRFSNCFAAMLRDNLGNFVARITVPLEILL